MWAACVDCSISTSMFQLWDCNSVSHAATSAAMHRGVHDGGRSNPRLTRCRVRVCVCQMYFDGSASLVDPPAWNAADLRIQCFPGPGQHQLEYFGFSALALLVICTFTFGWPLLMYVFLKHLFDQHAVLVQKADLPPGQDSVIIQSNRPASSEQRCVLWRL